MASVEAIGEPGTRRRRLGGKRWSGKREAAKSMQVRSFCKLSGDGWPVGGGGGAHEARCGERNEDGRMAACWAAREG
jgi:hypothetical protein